MVKARRTELKQLARSALLALGLALAACGDQSYADKAKAGDPQAEFLYAYYEHGGETPPNTPGASYTNVPAFNWMLRAAQAGYPPAWREVAGDYEGGQGTAVNLAEAARWYQKCAPLHDAICEHGLADMLVAGQALPKEVVQGYAWMVIYYWDAQSLNRPATGHLVAARSRGPRDKRHRLMG